MKKPIAFEVTQITTGPKHHLFGYIGHALIRTKPGIGAVCALGLSFLHTS